MKLKISLDRVKCFTTENTSGADDFYVVGATVAGGKTQAVLTAPLGIDDGQELAFPPDQRVVFDGPVADADTLHLGIAAYNRDVKGDWKRGDAASKITTAVGALPVPSGSLLVSTAYTAADAVFGRPGPDEKLGQLTLDVPVKDLKSGADKKWSCSGKSDALSSWQYEVYYTIEKA
ncbi:hypothetical protein [Streptomyces paromomycinus]|uniref:Uncharacterized protein n=1 Tax=Streptomyces paromomycinus TaxID=92743 RepID=A0A401VUA2_STREY|nr:hypothetical protein [Streptomyces paromomycinus]GCD40648.1 hypothetical protein GKJPGBOP_00301 [Streptomyces paromomycinus]